MQIYGTFYAPNDYRFYIAHHGVKGQKWGVRRYQNSDGSLTAAGKARAEKDKQGILARTKIRAQGAIGVPVEHIRGIANSKSIGGAIDNALGFGSGASMMRSQAYTQKRLAEASRTKLGKHIHNVKSYNAQQLSKYGQRVHDSKSVKSLVDNIVKDVPLKTIAGRDTTLYRHTAVNLLTGGVGNVVLDVVYLWNKAHAKKG